MIKKIKNNTVYITTFAFFLLFNFSVVYWNIKAKHGHFPSEKKYILYMMFSIALPIVIALINNHIKKIENKYLFLVILLGLLFMIGLPINAVPDEGAHVYRAYEISEGHLTSHIYKNKIVGRKLPKSFDKILSVKKYKDIFKALDVTSKTKRVETLFDTSALYSFVCYIPQVLGIVISRIFTQSVMIQLYFGRLFNFIIFTLLMYFSIKVIPTKKNVLFLIGLLPITIQEAISLSPDALTIASSIALISYVLHLREEKEKLLTKKQYINLAILCIIISQCKIVYVPLVLLLFILPNKKFKTKKHKYLSLLAITAVVIVLNLFWLNIASAYLEVSKGGKSSQQVMFILHNIFKYILICMNTINETINVCLYQLFGKHLAWFNIIVPDIYIILNIIFFAILSISDTEDKKFNIDKITRYIMIFLFISVVGLVLTSLYVQWTPYKEEVIGGIQGRYFIPIIMLVPFIIFNKKLKINKIIDYKYINLFIILQNICTFLLMIIYYV